MFAFDNNFRKIILIIEKDEDSINRVWKNG
jgi:hypothetical protein